jgi:hypothetical protein
MGVEAAGWVAGEALVDSAVVAPVIAGAGWTAGEALVDAGVSDVVSSTAGEVLADTTYDMSVKDVWDPELGKYVTPEYAANVAANSGDFAAQQLAQSAQAGSPGNIFSQYADQYMKAFNANPIRTGLETLRTGSSILNSLSGAMNTPTAPPQRPGAAAAQADPWAQYRPQYAARLNELQANPSLTMSEPGYQFFRQQGEQAYQRLGAKAGLNNSGNLGIALSNYNQDYALKAFNNLSDRYTGLAQANAKATTGVDAFQSAQKTAYDQNNDYFKALNQGVASIDSIFNPIRAGTPAPQASTPSGYNPSGAITSNPVAGMYNGPSFSGQLPSWLNPDYNTM